MFAIQKEFHFCYGHRVWNQKLDGRFTERGSVETKCRHLHGHQGTVSISLEADKLENQMVTDFKHLGWLKDFIEDHIDHKFILDRSDPLAAHLLGGSIEEGTAIGGTQLRVQGFRFNPVVVETTPVAWALDPSQADEYMSGFLLVDFCPTSERLAEWIWIIAATRMETLGIGITQVIWAETPKTMAAYIPDQVYFDSAN